MRAGRDKLTLILPPSLEAFGLWVEQLVAEWQASEASIVAPTYAGQRGNPVLFARAVFPELLAVQGDQGARAVLAADRSRIRLVAFDDPRPLADIDTPEDYERLLSKQ